MTATDTLRAMLDERGVEWAYSHEWEGKTFWPDANGINATATDWGNGLLVHAVLTPEQAIAATLGAETCFPALSSERDGIPYLNPWWVCSECGCQLTESRLGRIWQNYCPNCGRRIRIRRVDGE